MLFRSELVVSLLAILKAGGAYFPIDPAWPGTRREQLLRDAGCSLLVESPRAIRSTGHTSIQAAIDPASPKDRLAYVITTSGSTGEPKAVAITHQGILRLVHPINGFHLGTGAVVLQLATVAFDAATLEIWGPLLNGGTVVMAPPEQLSSSHQIGRAHV